MSKIDQSILDNLVEYESQDAGEDEYQGFSRSLTFSLPGSRHSAFSGPNDTDESQRRQVVKHFLKSNKLQPLVAVSPTSSLCNRHKQLDFPSITKIPANGRLYDIGYVDEILSEPNCLFCLLIRRWVYQNMSDFTAPGAAIKLSLFVLMSKFDNDNDFRQAEGVQKCQDKEYRVEAMRVGQECKSFPPDLAFHTEGRQLHDMIELNLAKTWLRTCCNTHGKICENNTFQKADKIFESFRLVDIRTRTVVTIHSPVEYIALSYVWGPDPLQTFRSNRSNSFDESGSLIDLKLPNKLPDTLDDAILLTKELGFCYLWIDAVCIVQDDKAHLDLQISKMGQIYSSAVMTIAAAGGDNVRAKIPGIQRGSRNPLAGGCLINEWKLELFPLIPRSKRSINQSAWATRAWTFQERVLSKRSLIFTKDQMFFHCLQGSQCEDTKRDRPPPNEILNQWADVYKTPSDVDKLFPLFNFLIRQYSQRRLKDPRDVLKACTGILKLLEEPYDTRFVLGMPQRNFHFALLWQPYEALQIRTNDGATSKPIFDNYISAMKHSYLPSWTWAGWVGEVFYQGSDFDMTSYQSEIKWENPHTNCKPNCKPECLGQLENHRILKFSTSYANFKIRTLNGIMDRIRTATLDLSNMRIKPNSEGEGCTEDNLKPHTTMRNVLILDDDEKAAGELILDTGLQFPEDRHYSFTALCLCRSIERTVWRSGWGGNLDLYAGENRETGNWEYVKYNEVEWSYVKVMMIIEDGDVAYRLGIGTIHAEAWEKQQLGQKSFRLA